MNTFSTEKLCSPKARYSKRGAVALLLFSQSVGLFATSFFSGWNTDYTGSEPNTLLLWKFDAGQESADSSGNGYNIAFSSRTQKGSGVAGRFGEAFLSEGPRSTANDSCAWSASSATAFNGEAMTVEFWFKPLSDDPIAGANLSYLFDKKYSETTGIQLALSSLSGADNALRLSVGNGTQSAHLQTPNLDWSEDTWYHIAVTYENVSGDGVMRIFRDGALLAENTVAGFGDLAAGTRFYRVTNRLGSSYNSVPGYYDNFRVSSVAYGFVEQPSIFPIGGYSGSPATDKADGFTWSGPVYGSSTAKLAESEANDQPFIYRVGVSIDFVGTPASELDLDFDAIEDEITAQVLAVVDSPTIVAWYLSPEELRYWRPLEMQYLLVASDAIRAADPKNRPIWMYEPNHRGSTALQYTFPFMDIATKGMYVNYSGRKYDRAWLLWTIDQVIDAVSTVNPAMQVMATLEMFQQPDPTEVPLIPTWVRHDSYASLIKGVEGIIIYSLANRSGFTARNDYYNAFAEVAEELNGERHLGAVFLQGTPQTPPAYTVVSGSDTHVLVAGGGGVSSDVTLTSLNAVSYKWWGDDYFFIVNSAPSPVTIELSQADAWKPLLRGQPYLESDRVTLELPAWEVSAMVKRGENFTGWQSDYSGSEPDTLLLWKFDSPTESSDESGNGHTATFAPSGVTRGSGVSGKFGNGFQSNWPRITTNAGYAQGNGTSAVFGENAMTVEFWYRPDSNNPTEGVNIAYFVDKKYSDSSGFQLVLSNLSGVSNAIRASVGNGSSVATLSTDSLTWVANQWYHIAVTYENISGDGFLRIFRDGEILADWSISDFGDLDAGTRSWRLGNRLGSSYSSVPGTYDNFRISARAINFAKP